MQISNLGYDDYIGRLGIGRVNKGKIKNGQTVTLVKNDGKIESFRISKLFVNEGIKKVEKDIAYYGDIVTIAGCPDISIVSIVSYNTSGFDTESSYPSRRIFSKSIDK